MRIQLWSQFYDPEPTGIGPLSGAWARAMRSRGHDVLVVAAHPFYPEPQRAALRPPRREVLDGVPVVRLPLLPGRCSARERIVQDASFSGALALRALALPRPDVLVAVSPSFPALSVAMAFARARRVPWALWLQDVLPDGATSTGVLHGDGAVLRGARRLEAAAYASASRIVVIGESFRRNLAAKGVPDDAMTTIHNPATRPVRHDRPVPRGEAPVVATMGNVGLSQGLEALVAAFERSPELAEAGARLRILGDGVRGDAVRAAATTDRVAVTGVLERPALDAELHRTRLALVSQRYDGEDFNVPSKLMNFMAEGIATLVVGRPGSEAHEIVRRSRGGWFHDVARLDELGPRVRTLLDDRAQLARRGAAAATFAEAAFLPDVVAARWERVLRPLVPAPRRAAAAWSPAGVVG